MNYRIGFVGPQGKSTEQKFSGYGQTLTAVHAQYSALIRMVFISGSIKKITVSQISCFLEGSHLFSPER